MTAQSSLVERINRPDTGVIKLDVDGPMPNDLTERIEFVFATLGVRVREMGRVTSPRGNGHHVMVKLSDPVPALAAVAIQAILGSDWRRETFNLQRALVLADAPEFWHFRWNVLYSEKLGDAAMIDVNKFGGPKREALKPEMLDGDAAVVTITDVEEIEVERDGEKRPVLVLTFKETGEYAFYPNVTGIKHLVKGLGTDERDWNGKKIALEKVQTENPSTKQKVTSLWVASPDTWRTHARAAGASLAKRPRAAKSAAKKSAAKK